MSYDIIAVGGGGFTHDEDPDLDEFCLEGLPARPAIGFIGAASEDDPVKIDRFYNRFGAMAKSLSHLPISADISAARQWVAGLDLIYVGGGNTAWLIDHFNTMGLSDLLREANRSGTLLAGVSAGAVCWFEMALTDSLGDGLQPIRGLAIAPGSSCPHFSTESHRRPAFRDAVAKGEIPAGFAIDDGVALRLSGDKSPQTYSARENCDAYLVSSDGMGGWRQTSLNNAPAPSDHRGEGWSD